MMEKTQQIMLATPEAENISDPSGPSSLYRANIWRFGMRFVRICPRRACVWLAHVFASAYWLLAGERRRVVVGNLLPAVRGDAAAAEAAANRLIHHFAVKVVDLWRYEAGLPFESVYGNALGWEHFEKARAQGRGVLVVTPHLGNWEFGGLLLRQRGIQLQVITLAEPGKGFTQLRKASRARWNIQTLVIGDDPFGVLDVIKRLEHGATVALLLDRPPASSAMTIQLFGRPFPVSVAMAELARASGCVILPVYLPRRDDVYDAYIMPAVDYDRAALRDRPVRQELTQRIMSAFEPIILKHLDQWYHFVPIWKEEER